MTKLLKIGKCWSGLECRIMPINGKEQWLAHYGFLETDSQGNALSSKEAILDANYPTNVEAEKERRADAFRYGAHGIAIENPESQTLVACNPTFARMLGFGKPEEMEGLSMWSLYSPDQIELIKMYVNIVDHFGSMSFESVFRRKDGSNIDVHIELVSDKDVKNKINYRVATVLDITDRNRRKPDD